MERCYILTHSTWWSSHFNQTKPYKRHQQNIYICQQRMSRVETHFSFCVLVIFTILHNDSRVTVVSDVLSAERGAQNWRLNRITREPWRCLSAKRSALLWSPETRRTHNVLVHSRDFTWRGRWALFLSTSQRPSPLPLSFLCQMAISPVICLPIAKYKN